MRQRNSQIHALENLDHLEEEEKLNEFRSSLKGGSNKKGVTFGDGVRKRATLTRTPELSSSNSEDFEKFGDSFMVLEFNESTETETIQWIIEKIRGRKIDGGAELMVRKEPLTKYGGSALVRMLKNFQNTVFNFTEKLKRLLCTYQLLR